MTNGYNMPPDVAALIEEGRLKLQLANSLIRSGTVNAKLAAIVAEIDALLGGGP